MRCWDSEPAERVAFAVLSALAFGKILYLVMGLEAYGSFILILIRVTRQDLPIFVVIYTVRRARAAVDGGGCCACGSSTRVGERRIRGFPQRRASALAKRARAAVAVAVGFPFRSGAAACLLSELSGHC